jgi:RNA polymerase sigma-70 factor (ECF subfamily)
LEDVNSNRNELIWLLKKGDMVAFDTIYERYCKRLYGFVLRYIKQKEDAQGIVQEVFIKIWETRNKIDVYSSFDSFIFTIAYNTTISLLRKRVSEQEYLKKLKSSQQIFSGDQIIDEIHFKEINTRINVLLGQLTPRQKEIFLLSREQGLTHTEIAKKLGISTNTVKNHLVTALAFIKSHIDSGLVLNGLFASLFL